MTHLDSSESVAPSLEVLAEPRHGLADRSVDRIVTFRESRPPRSRVTWTRSKRVDPASQTVVCLVARRTILHRRQALEQKQRGTRNNVPPRFVFPMRKRAEGAFRKGHLPSHQSPTDAVGAAGARLASPRSTCSTRRASRFVPGCGRRPAGAVRHPSVIDSEWTRVRCAIRSVDGRLGLEAVTPLSALGWPDYGGR